LGGTAGRTTLAGEGLQHQDGHSPLLASTVPNCRSFDPAYAYELAVILHDGMRRMVQEGENCFYYLTVMNENYPQPAMPEGAEEGILRGLYRLREGGDGDDTLRVRLLGSGTILREVLAAAELLESDFQIPAEVWSVTSWGELRREGLEAEHWNALHPGDPQRTPIVAQCLEGSDAPVIAATDYMRAVPDQIRSFVPARYRTLGTDGFGRSDTRERLRYFFEVNRHFVAIAALKALSDEGHLPPATVQGAIEKFGIAPSKPVPWRH
ncbi:MAG: pyruvate dehydrogenase (acetyl-transferring), homodimeric type, partial [Deltaproteobacteria bacterium]|nr:pyruvate dehydrogenase (acetyl-transferring), homodimeric type [Deltaproteobacteria bacterium]